MDVIVEILNYNERSKLEELLRSLGFSHDISSNIVCRYVVDGISVDIVPTKDNSIGFNNLWYPSGYKNAIAYEVSPVYYIKILNAPHFFATKLEAFKSRGANDGRISHDFEDIVFVMEHRSNIWQELAAT